MTPADLAIIKGGAMVATGGMMAELIIFNDPMYTNLAAVGAIVSALGVFHELTNDNTEHNLYSALGEIIKGITLGFLAIPFWYLILSGLGNNLLAKYLEVSDAIKMEKSIWLIISFGLSWYTVPIFNWLVGSIKVIGIKIRKVWSSNA